MTRQQLLTVTVTLKHSETLGELVVYQALYGERGIWVRPLAMFEEKVDVNGNLVNRFRCNENNLKYGIEISV